MKAVRLLSVIVSALGLLVIAPKSLGQTPSAKVSAKLDETSNDVPPFRFTVGPSLYVIKVIGEDASGSALGFSGSFGGRVGGNFYLNLDVGYMKVTDGSDYLKAFAVLPGFLYSFTEEGTVRPYLGAALGPAFLSDKKDSMVLPMAAVKPGMDIQLMRNLALNVEPAVGLIGPVILFIPRANVVLRF